MQPVRRLMLECGPRFVGTATAGVDVRARIAEARERYNLDLSVLIYDREPSLPHTNVMPGARVAPDILALYRLLNDAGYHFNLALNGSPDFDRSVPLNKDETRCLKDLEISGAQTGVRNAVTIADNALVPGLKSDFPGLEVIGSCVSVCFEPNLTAFSREHGVTYDDPLFLVKYYRHLYSIYDRVVPISQLGTPGFLFALELTRQELSDKTVLFLDLGCGARALGRCVNHYRGILNERRAGLPVIPERYLAQPEDQGSSEVGHCPQMLSSLELVNRQADLRALLAAGCFRFKVPARLSGAELSDDLDFLCRLSVQRDPPEVFPEREAIAGFTRMDIKLDFTGKYPPAVHRILRDYDWPDYDSFDGGKYRGETARRIGGQLHSRAAALWQSLSART